MYFREYLGKIGLFHVIFQVFVQQTVFSARFLPRCLMSFFTCTALLLKKKFEVRPSKKDLGKALNQIRVCDSIST